LIGFENVLSPAEQLLWEAYYALEPYGGELKYLAYMLQVLSKSREPFFPSECKLDVPLEDIDLDKQRDSVKQAMTSLVEEQLGMSIAEYMRRNK
jgi:hypothetical protein